MDESKINQKIIHDSITMLNMIYNMRKDTKYSIEGISVESKMNYLYNKTKQLLGDICIINSGEYDKHIKHTTGTSANIKKLQECDKAILDAYNIGKNIQMFYITALVNKGSAEPVIKVISDASDKIKLAHTKLMSYYHVFVIKVPAEVRAKLTVNEINQYAEAE